MHIYPMHYYPYYNPYISPYFPFQSLHTDHETRAKQLINLIKTSTIPNAFTIDIQHPAPLDDDLRTLFTHIQTKASIDLMGVILLHHPRAIQKNHPNTDPTTSPTHIYNTDIHHNTSHETLPLPPNQSGKHKRPRHQFKTPWKRTTPVPLSDDHRSSSSSFLFQTTTNHLDDPLQLHPHMGRDTGSPHPTLITTTTAAHPNHTTPLLTTALEHQKLQITHFIPHPASHMPRPGFPLLPPPPPLPILHLHPTLSSNPMRPQDHRDDH